MNLFTEFLIKNFFLFCLTLAVIFMSLRSYRSKRVMVTIPILVVSLCLLLSLLYFFEQLAAPHDNLVFLATLCCALGFILRPLVLYFFMRMTVNKKSVLIVAWVLIGINAIVYLLSLFIFARDLTKVIFFYENGVVTRGPLFYFAHGLIGVMALYFVIFSISRLKGRHRYDALACLICGFFVIIAVVLETYEVADYLLNTTIAISVLFYVVHLYEQASVRDALTNLFDRKAYYHDMNKIENKVNGIIMIDMNSLKWLNDNKGHEEGDKAIKTIADIIYSSLDSRHMDAYRMGGDEFLVMSTSSRFSAVDNTINNIREKMNKTPYKIAIGYAKRESPEQRVQEMESIAEKMMYEDKAHYYQTSGVERRKR